MRQGEARWGGVEAGSARVYETHPVSAVHACAAPAIMALKAKPGATGAHFRRHPEGTPLHTASGLHHPHCCPRRVAVIHATHTFLLRLLLQLAVALVNGCLPRVDQLHCTAPGAEGASLQQQKEVQQQNKTLQWSGCCWIGF